MSLHTHVQCFKLTYSLLKKASVVAFICWDEERLRSLSIEATSLGEEAVKSLSTEYNKLESDRELHTYNRQIAEYYNADELIAVI